MFDRYKGVMGAMNNQSRYLDFSQSLFPMIGSGATKTTPVFFHFFSND
jgi:hypothetical protein